MTDFTRVFGGSAISAALSDYSSISFSSNITLQWPIEAVPATALLLVSSKVIDAAATAAGLSMKLPEANKVSKGYTIFVNNVGANSFVVKNNSGADIVTITSGNSYLLYLVDNSSAAGVWRTIQAGAVSSAAVASALAGAGLKVTGSLLAVAFPTVNKSTNYTVGESDRAKTLRWTGGTGTFTLPDPTTMATDFFFFFRNDGSGTLSLTPAAGTINGVASVSVSPSGSGIIYGNGSLYYSVGIGTSSTVGFDYTSIAVPGTGNYILSGAELNRIAYKFTGILTGSRTIEVPNTVQQYWVDNATTGAFTLSVKTAAGASVTVTQGQRALLYCNGTDVIDADTQGISSPVAIADGGTGATTAGAARANLGSTSVGDALFIAASAAAARTAIGSGATGDLLFTAASAAAAWAIIDDAALATVQTWTATQTIFGASDSFIGLVIEGNNVSINAGPGLRVYRNKNGVNNDLTAYFELAGKDAAGGVEILFGLYSQWLNSAAGLEASRCFLRTLRAGGSADWYVSRGTLHYSTIGEPANAGEINATAYLANGLRVDAPPEVALADGPTITPDFSLGINFVVVLGGNRTLANPTNQLSGRTGRIAIVQDATGSRTLAYGANWKFVNGVAPVLSTAANAVDILHYDVVNSSGLIFASLSRDVK